jgi:hypothetical protein
LHRSACSLKSPDLADADVLVWFEMGAPPFVAFARRVGRSIDERRS